MKMCLEYFKNVYENPVIRSNTPNFDLEEIMEMSHTRRFTGTTLDSTVIGRFERRIPFELNMMEDRTVDHLKVSLEKSLPVIVIYNAAFLETNERGPAHAGVVIGMSSSDGVVLANPWFGFGFHIKKVDFERAWEMEYSKAIFFKPIPQTSLEVS